VVWGHLGRQILPVDGEPPETLINTTPGLPDTLDALVGVNTDRGYTEHEHLDEVGVIHMNGRIYDPLIGRFMSADPTIPNIYNLASFNRYSYLPGTAVGDRSAQYWAGRVIRTDFYQDPSARVGLFLSVLWTPDTAIDTALTLVGGEAFTLGKKAVTYAGSKILGTAQSTGTVGHAMVSNVVAHLHALNPNVAKVTLDLGYKKLMSGVQEMVGKYGPRPDVGVLFKDGSVKVVEVASKTDVPQRLAQRNLDKMAAENIQGSVSVNNWAVWLNKLFGH
jgi:RHS repeat-associated protein